MPDEPTPIHRIGHAIRFTQSMKTGWVDEVKRESGKSHERVQYIVLNPDEYYEGCLGFVTFGAQKSDGVFYAYVHIIPKNTPVAIEFD